MNPLVEVTATIVSARRRVTVCRSEEFALLPSDDDFRDREPDVRIHLPPAASLVTRDRREGRDQLDHRGEMGLRTKAA
jgi:hypothetical protein